MNTRTQKNTPYSPKILPGAYNVILDRKLEGFGKEGAYTTLFFTNKSSHKDFFVTLFHSKDTHPIGGGVDFNFISEGSPMWIHLNNDPSKYPVIVNAEYGWRHLYKGSAKLCSNLSDYQGPLRKDIDEDAYQMIKSVNQNKKVQY